MASAARTEAACLAAAERDLRTNAMPGWLKGHEPEWTLGRLIGCIERMAKYHDDPVMQRHALASAQEAIAEYRAVHPDLTPSFDRKHGEGAF